MPACRLCDATSGFVKAHVIPEAFFRELRDDKEVPLLVTGAAGQVPKKKLPIGVYDREILCGSCEGKFLQWDTYGIDVLLTHFEQSFKPMLKADTIIGYEAVDVDKSKLLDFLTSVMWRASIASHPFYKAVKLGPYEEAIRNDMLACPGHAPESINAVLSRWKDEDNGTLPTTGLLNPHRERWAGVNAYRLYLGKTVAYVKFDQRPFSDEFAKFSLRSLEPLRIIGRSLASSKDLYTIRKIVMSTQKNLTRLRNRKGRP
jgi:hypothetical protein